MNKLIKALSVFGLGALIVLAVGAIKDETGTVRYRDGAVLSFNPTVTIRDEDSAWTLSMTGLAALANGGSTAIAWTASTLTLGATTNQINFGGTNAAPVSTNLIRWVSVTLPGDTNAYVLGLAK